MRQKQLQVAQSGTKQRQHLEADLAAQRQELTDIEARLAQEQAAINRFRMQCRLKIGKQVDTLLELRAQKQMLLTRLELERQAHEDGFIFDDEAFFNEDVDDDEEEQAWGGLEEAVAVGKTADNAATKRLYRELARRFHPDLAFNSGERAYRTSIMAAINSAYANKNVQALRDLAGELDPATVHELNLTDHSNDIRKLHEQILACKRRQRKIALQLKALRQENTAKLWRRAKQLEDEGQNWWEEIRLELEQAIGQMNAAVDKLTLESLKRQEREEQD